jgi:hypothetical protein
MIGLSVSPARENQIINMNCELTTEAAAGAIASVERTAMAVMFIMIVLG